MNRTVRYALLFFTLLLTAIPLGGCIKAPPHGGENTDLSESRDDPEPSLPSEIDLTLYKLIRGDNCSEEVKSTMIRLRSAMETATGIKPGIGTDYVSGNDSDRTEYELILGPTNIPEAETIRASLKKGEYAVRFFGTKIVIVGYSDIVTSYAARQFCLKFLGTDYFKPTAPAVPVRVISPENLFGTVTEEDIPFAGEPVGMTPAAFSVAGGSFSDGTVAFRSTGTMDLRSDTGSGAFRVRFRVRTKNGKNPERIQLFINTSSGHILVHQIGNHVQLELNDYQRGSRGFSDSIDDYTLRADVFPAAGTVRYYVNDKLLGEVNVDKTEPQIRDKCRIRIAVVGNSIDTSISEFYLENIPEIEPRRYDALPLEIGDEEVYPKSENKPASVVYVVKAEGLSDEELLSLVTLQGNVNRTTPRLFVDYRKYNNDRRYSNVANDESYLTILKNKGRTLETITLSKALKLFADDYEGIVLGRPFSDGYSENVITSVCGVTDSVYVPDYLYKSMRSVLFDKPVVYDCTEKNFKNAIDAYRSVWEEFSGKFSKTSLFHLPVGSDREGHPTMICRDYAVMSRSFTFCSDEVETLDDYNFYMSVFASTAPNTGILGKGGGLFDEFEMFHICGQFGKYFTYVFSTPNLSLLNSLEIGELKQSVPEPVVLEKGTTYACYDLSEGDNLSWDYHLWMKEYYDAEKRAMTPKGYSLAGATYYLCPSLIEYYYQNATPADCFFLDGGGISDFASPDGFGLLLESGDREKAVTRMLQLTEYVLKKTDIHVLRAIHNISDKMAERYDKEVPSLTMLLSSYGNYTPNIGGFGGDYRNSVKMIGDLVRVRCAFSTFKKTMGESFRELVSAAPSEDGTYFCEVFAYANRFFDDFSKLKELEAEFSAGGCGNLKVVRPDQFAELYKQYITEKNNGKS